MASVRDIMGAVIGSTLGGMTKWATEKAIEKAGGGSKGGSKSGSSGGGSGGGSYGGSSGGGGGGWNDGTNYHQDAIDYAKAGNYDAMVDAIMKREAKVIAQGGDDRGISSADILKQLKAQYFTPEVPKFDYREAPSFGGSRWDDRSDEAAKDFINMNYDDWLNSDQYAALAERYGQNGQLAMRDLLGQISSRTGGLASSYATTAAQQQYNDYMAKLEQAAREMYSGERSDLFENAQLAGGMAQSEYNRYLDELNQWNNDRNYAYNQYQDELANSRYDQQWAYQTEQDAQAQRRADAETMAAYGDFSGYRNLGYSDGQIASMLAAYQADAAKGEAKSASGGGAKAEGDYDALFAAASRSMSPQNFIASNYKKYGFTSSAGLSSAYQKWHENGDSAPSLDYDQDEGIFTFDGKTYNNLKKLINDINAAGLTPEQEQAIIKKLGLFGFDVT